LGSLQLQSIRKAFGDHEVLKGIDLEVQDGEFVIFVGPSGCGKSTLLRVIAGLEDATSGSIRIDGEEVATVPPAKRGIAMVFQSYALYPHLTVKDNMGLGLKQAGTDKGEIEARVAKASAMLSLDPYLARRPAELSGGQRQRVAIGRAIVREPKLFLFDEPLSNLDAALRVQTRLEIAGLHRRLKATMIYVTHDQVEAMTLADKIVLLRSGADVLTHGSVAQVGAPLTLYREPANLFVATFLGSPKMNLLPMTVAAIDAHGLELHGAGGHVLHAAVAADGVKPGDAVTLGARSEDLQLHAEGGAGCLPCRVQWVERLGDMTYAYLGREGAETPLVVRLDGRSTAGVGDGVHLHWPPTSCHVFDGTGAALRRLAP
jgi:multiple sugar transport system ATP-binding protein